MVSSSSSSILLRKRTSDIGRRRSGGLGAVKKAVSDENGWAETVAERSEEPSAREDPQPQPAPEPAAEPAHAAAAEAEAEAGEGGVALTARFQRQLTESHAADAWFDAQMAPKPGAARGGKPAGGGGTAVPHVQSAASQIVDKALKYITAERAAATPPPAQDPGHVFKLGSASILDKGLDAITGVGKLMESFAMTLDSVIGQAFEEWGTPKSAERPRPLQPRNSQALAGERMVKKAAQPSASSGTAAGAAGVGARGAAALKQTHMTSFMNRMTDASEEDVAEWHRRAVGLQSELQKLQSQIQENQRLRDEYTKMQRDLQQTATAVSKLEQENSLLKQRTAPAPEADVAAVDPLAAEQVRLQMEALLAEKAKLAQENARLLRENTGLQELLEFTMMAQAELVGDDELFGDDHASHGAWSAAPSSSAGTSPKRAEEYGQPHTPTAAMAQLAL